MNQITLKNYRCFGEKQTARLAPLTLLVGGNSTGKTSFLAMVRVLLDVAVANLVPDFKEKPYDLGSFAEIVHQPNSVAKRANTFEAGFEVDSTRNGASETIDAPYSFKVVFDKRDTSPYPSSRYFSHGGVWIQEYNKKGRSKKIQVGTHRGAWEKGSTENLDGHFHQGHLLPLFISLASESGSDGNAANRRTLSPIAGAPEITSEDRDMIDELISQSLIVKQRPFASAPVRSMPHRTYDPSRSTWDTEGDYVPMYLARQNRRRKSWATLKKRLEDFGEKSGLFGRISIRRLGRSGSDPFQIQITSADSDNEEPPRNLIDVGYGISQVLPLITELVREDSPEMFLLQQPEVHLHPSAQAALGSLFCAVASQGHQLIVETHSDYILDRVRMDVRDGVCGLKPEDVSILFFERQGLGVQIHSIRLDEEGNVLDAPPAYGDFFINETTRSLGL